VQQIVVNGATPPKPSPRVSPKLGPVPLPAKGPAPPATKVPAPPAKKPTVKRPTTPPPAKLPAGVPSSSPSTQFELEIPAGGRSTVLGAVPDGQPAPSITTLNTIRYASAAAAPGACEDIQTAIVACHACFRQFDPSYTVAKCS
jgi:hypothetical protein